LLTKENYLKSSSKKSWAGTQHGGDWPHLLIPTRRRRKREDLILAITSRRSKPEVLPAPLSLGQHTKHFSLKAEESHLVDH
jgi:hypothetical protein